VHITPPKQIVSLPYSLFNMLSRFERVNIVLLLSDLKSDINRMHESINACPHDELFNIRIILIIRRFVTAKESYFRV
jgi:hypothetical protein